MKVGTDLDESLYDPNEVVLNAKKFDSLFQNFKFNSIDDIDKIAEITSDEESNTNLQSKPSDAAENEDKKSYTNTVNSKEFREYLKKKGLFLFPTKPNGNHQSVKQDASSNRNTLIESKIPVKINHDATVEMNQSDRKKTVFRRLSSIFSKKKTTPKSNDVTPVLSFTGKKGERNGSAIKRVMLERTKLESEDNRPVLANNEFLTSKNFLVSKSNGVRLSLRQEAVNEQLSVDDKNVGVPLQLRPQSKIQNSSVYRNIDLKRSKLYQTIEPQHEKEVDELPSFDTLRLSNDVIKPRPYPNITPKNAPNNGYPISSRNSKNYHENFLEKPPVKTQDLASRLSSQKVSINEVKHSAIDPFMFAKIHEIKRKTDEVLLNKSLNDENKDKLNNQYFVRNSQQRSTFSEGYANYTNYRCPQTHIPKQNSTLQAQRSQSVLDNMTCYNNSLYGEVTYRQPNSSQDVNVIMRRPSSSTLDKKQIMEKIYDYYRKSVDNSPVPFERKNYQLKSSLSPKVPSQKFNDYRIVQNKPIVPQGSSTSRMPQNSFRSLASRSRISESDSEFATETASLDDYPHYFNPNRGESTPVRVGNYHPSHPQEEQRIYDVVDPNPRNVFNNNMERLQRVILPRPQPLLSRGDIIYNNKIYRPISAIVKEVPLSPRSPSKLSYESRNNYKDDFYQKATSLRKPELTTLRSNKPIPNQYSGK